MTEIPDQDLLALASIEARREYLIRLAAPISGCWHGSDGVLFRAPGWRARCRPTPSLQRQADAATSGAGVGFREL